LPNDCVPRPSLLPRPIPFHSVCTGMTYISPTSMYASVNGGI
jgi:hypothetical protein